MGPDPGPAVEEGRPLKQYEIWWADLPEPVGRRPVLLLSRDAAYVQLSRILVVEVTTTIRSIQVEVPLGLKEGLRQRSVANLDNAGLVGRSRLRSRIGALAPDRHSEVKRALGHALAWPELTGVE